ncbi:MAG: TonB-dependent receptor [Rhodothalassiaceae bacterium]
MTGPCRARSWLMLATSLTAPAVPCIAQQGDSAEPDAPMIEEMIVTARRRAESLQDVPIAISAFDTEAVKRLQADTIAGLQNAVPNLTLTVGDANNAVVYLRGIGQNDSLAFADPGVGIYVDDVFIARSQAAFLELFNVQRVEVLRGPQGTLYGRNTIGGAVKFVSTPPPESLDAYLELGAGNFNFGVVRGRIGGPLSDTVQAKLAFSLRRRDGFAQNTLTDQDDGDVTSFAGRVGLAWQPNDRFSLLVSADGRVDRPDTSRSPVRETDVIGIADPTAAEPTLSVFPPNPDPYVVDVNANGLNDQSAFGISLKAVYDLAPEWTIESITAYRQFHFLLNLDTDASPLPILDVFVEQDQQQISQELRLTYDGGAVKATSGFYFFHDDDLTFSGVDNAAAALFGLPVTAFGFATSSLADTDQRTNSFAGYVDASWDLTDRLQLSAGLRYTYENRRSERRFENFFDPSVSIIEDQPPFLAGVGVPGVAVAGEASFDALTPRVALAYDLSADVLAYASVSRGFKSGGFDGRATTDFAFQPFDPEFVWTYEAGLKTAFYNNRLAANLTYFFNDYQDLQVTSFGADPMTGVFVSLFTNAAEATTQGVEFDLTAYPVERLQVRASVGFLDAEYDEFEILVAGEVTDVSDLPLVNAPRWTAFLGLTYEQPLGRFELIGHVDAAYRGETFNEITASPLLAQDNYVLLNAFAAIRTEDGRWEVRGGVQNISDREIRVQGFNLTEFPGYQAAFFAAPRTWDVRLFYRF